MADPVSLVLGVIAFAAQAVQTSKALLELVADIRDAPGSIKAVYNEVYAFHNVVSSLSTALKGQDVQIRLLATRPCLR